MYGILKITGKIERNYCYQIYGNRCPDCELLSTRLLSGSENSFQSSCVYLSESSVLPRPDTDSRFIIFCCGADTDFSVYEECSFTVTYFGADVSLPDLFNCTMEFLSETQALAAGMHILVNALFSGNACSI